MPQRFVDLSIYLENDVISDPPFLRPKITYQTHAETVEEARHFFPDVDAERLSRRRGIRCGGVGDS